jgi:hypothetical protein
MGGEKTDIMWHVFTMQYTSLLLKYGKWISTDVFLHSFTHANAGHLEIKEFITIPLPK